MRIDIGELLTEFVLCFILVVYLLAISCSEIYEAGYRNACRDFHNGKLKYDLVVNADGTREWKKVGPKGHKEDVAPEEVRAK